MNLTTLFKKKHKTNLTNFAELWVLENSYLLKPTTLKTYYSNLNKLKRFKPEIFIEDIDRNFLQAYKKHLITEVGNSLNTTYKSLSFLRSLLNKAQAQGIYNEHKPFSNFPLKKAVGHRANLNRFELDKLCRFYENTKLPGQKNVLRYFLFSCFTGLRYVDIKNLKYSNIDGNMISMQQHKTEQMVKIPLINQARTLIDDSKSDNFIFESISNQKTNKHLKRIARECNINKTLTFHVARHTFATIGLNLGIPLEVVSKLLGHTDIKTTQIYAKVQDDLLITEMKKFEKLAKVV
ncbi:MAG: site-specific integrase [Bacteroidales bacterium]|nr:site-specific integrase [Bacteroidales bacterium]